ncbi:hypothetical protein CDL15_Pgr009589 [Punica granatum]|nr:hypothetical protein CDL15_Pgr009589 [Punica granatum]
MEEVMLPGFRFHPTDEELVGFYLKRKIQQRPLSIELIKQLDIYKYDPWDLPKLASTGEKEWYFYCPRDRKYRNSARPNRVTGAGFWKATGTDRPIYSSEGTKCIGLKKSLVFYRGRAAKGVKTEWMMHEFRLPSLVDPTSQNTFADKTIPAHDSWAICRIFKKTNSTAHQRANFSQHHHHQQSNLSPVSTETNISSESLNPPKTPLTPQVVPSQHQNNVPFILTNIRQVESSPPTDMCSSLEFATSYNTLSSTLTPGLINNGLDNFLISPLQTLSEMSSTNKSSLVDFSSILFNMSCSDFGDIGRVCEGLDVYGGSQHHHGQFNNEELYHVQSDLQSGLMKGPQEEEQWDRSVGLSYGVTNLNGEDAWRSNLVGWDMGELSTLFSTNTTKCYT